MQATAHISRTSAIVFLAVAMAALAPAVQSAPAAVAGAPAAAAVFARVGDTSITHDEYNAAFTAATRAKFYHGKPPDAEIAALQREVADQLVARIVLLREVKRRGLHPDVAAIQKQVAAYEQRYANSEPWKKSRAQMLPPLVARLEQEDVLAQIEKSVRDQSQPSETQVNAYFNAHRDKFTEPEQMRVSVILLKVDPSASSATWKASEEQAKGLAVRARAGEDFAVLARQFSAEASAPQGGDMGYLHSGMLPEGSQGALEKMKTGEISVPQRLLEGFAVFRLTDRKLATAHTLDEVKVRARELTQRDQANMTWDAFIKDLKGKTTVQIDQSRFLPLAK
jgi:parvulin-like peptidyl-prolyl isomerase